MNTEFFSEHLEVVLTSPERRPAPPVRRRSFTRDGLKKQGSIRKLLFGSSSKSKSNAAAESSSSNDANSAAKAKKALSFDSSNATVDSSKLTTRRKSLRLTKSLEDGAPSSKAAPAPALSSSTSRSRKPLKRQHTFDPNMAPLPATSSAPNVRIPRIRHSTGTSTTNTLQRQKSCSRLPTRRPKLVRSASFHRSSSSSSSGSRRKLVRNVRFGEVKIDTYEDGSSLLETSTFWYSKQHLDLLLDRELQIAARSQGTTQHNNLLQCCSRGIEQQLAGENKEAKINTYVQTILRAEADIRKRSSTSTKTGGADYSNEILMISQILTKEDRTKACKMGFKDASEVQMMMMNHHHNCSDLVVVDNLEMNNKPTKLVGVPPSSLMTDTRKPIASKSA